MYTFCASRKAYFKRFARAEVDTGAINYATKYTTRMKAKLFYCLNKFIGLVLIPGTPE